MVNLDVVLDKTLKNLHETAEIVNTLSQLVEKALDELQEAYPDATTPRPLWVELAMTNALEYIYEAEYAWENLCVKVDKSND